MEVFYRVTHLLTNLGWVDVDFGCSTLLTGSAWADWPNWLSSWARWWNIPNKSQPNLGSPGDVSPCICCLRDTKIGRYLSNSHIPGGAATCSEVFIKCFLRAPRLLGCTAAAMLPKQARGTFRKHVTKPLEQVAAPPNGILQFPE